MKLWIDKQGGRHFHKADCLMVEDSRFHYEPIEKVLRYYKLSNLPHDIIVDHKRYMPCPGCFGK